jgi:uncharacterized membrane protein
MKVTTITKQLKMRTIGLLAAATLAGAVLTAAAPAAQAEQFGVGIRIGGPRYFAPVPPPRVYVAPPYGYPLYGYGWRPREEWRLHHGFRRW